MKPTILSPGGDNMDSLWLNTATPPHFDPQAQNIKTDVLIIGGGIAGILCACMLERAGVNYVLCEADKICSGITKNTTAKITLQHGLIYDKLLRRFGLEKAQMYLEANRTALDQYRNLCQTIDCDFEEADSFVYSMNNRAKLEREVPALNKIGCPAEFIETPSIPVSAAGAVLIKHQAQFNPLKFLYAISQGLNIKENTKVLELKPRCAVTNRGKIAADKIIVSTHFPFLNKHGSYFLKMYQHRSYVLALRNARPVEGMYVDESDKGMSFRQYDDLLILGGGGHRTGKKGGNWDELTDFARHHYPNSTEAFRWSTQDCMTLDGIPYIGQYSANTHNLYVAAGFNKWGMTSAMTAAAILTDMILGRDNPCAEVFSPSRTVLRPQLAINAVETVTNLLTPTTPRCPHMGCALKYNPQDHSWDCPCHGSRFTSDGKLIDNPSTDDLPK